MSISYVYLVMAGLVPAIHILTARRLKRHVDQGVDARDRRGHDGYDE
jgi:hypothetical protein